MGSRQRSYALVRSSFWSTFGFFLLTTVIGGGFSLILRSVAISAPWGTVMAIVGNAYIGTGLAVALLVFYRTRVLWLEGHPSLPQKIAEIQG
ncbi:hypothetical protein KFU94_65970 [Chloroflexi bacterium TSY]|nr:hypothetical protein [Chloroflexi bacterium TSY]